MSPAFFKRLNQAMVLLWRLGLGRAVNFSPRWMGRILVLRVHGRVSGKPRFSPLNYAPEPGEVYCVAGFGARTDWLRNLRAHPECEVWLPGERRRGLAELVEEPGERLLRLRSVLQNSGFAAKTFGGVDPFACPDELLERRTADYAVVRITLLETVRGPGGPGDLGWCWGLLTLVLLAGWSAFYAADQQR